MPEQKIIYSNGCEKEQKILSITDLSEVEKKYIDIEDIKPFPELPICVLIPTMNKDTKRLIKESLQRQENFANFVAVYFSEQEG